MPFNRLEGLFCLRDQPQQSMPPMPNALLSARTQLWIAAPLLCCALNSTAADFYAGVGLPGITVGFAQDLDSSLTLRAEYTLGTSRQVNGTRGGAVYTGAFKGNTGKVVVDWYPANNSGFHLSGGMAVNSVGVQLASSGTNISSINGKAISLAGAQVNASLKLPTLTPYLGIGWGHRTDTPPGFSFQGSMGVLVGKLDVALTSNIVTLSGGAITDQDLQAEALKVRDAVSKLRLMPTASIGVAYTY
jgi:hypothetical protein